MTYKKIDGLLLKQLFGISAGYFGKNAEYINSLNVFPVPDGDTGTNMNLTIQAGLNAINSCDDTNLSEMIRVLSRGMLLGARGNSGVILSQIWRGMSQVLDGKSDMDTQTFAAALQGGADVAYRSVMKPVEGTILTVIRETAADSLKIAETETEFIPFLEQVVVSAKKSLEGTPELLPVLKEVGVVDSGGQGLVILLEGMLLELKGVAPSEMETHEAVNVDWKSFEYEDVHGDDEFGFCTEFIIQLADKASFDEKTVSEQLLQDGTSLVVVHDDDILKVHIHTETPLAVFEKYGKYGEFMWIKAENMSTQVEEREAKEGKVNSISTNDAAQTQTIEPVDIAIVSVSSGAGIARTFKDLGVHIIVDGGQTSNPSTKDFIDAMEKVAAKAYIILPNNSNIILAAEQVKSLSDKPVEIVPSKTIPQGLAAAIAYNPMDTAADNVQNMTAALTEVKSGEVTTAVRDTVLNGVEIIDGSYISINDKEIVASKDSLFAATIELLQKMIDEESEIVTLIEGVGVSVETQEAMIAYIERTFPDVELEYIQGEQQVYFYLVSVE
jgi:DAK2 domain fusion protein YloV